LAKNKDTTKCQTKTPESEKYTAHVVLGKSDKTWYYQHILNKIEKGSLIGRILGTNVGPQLTPFIINDTTLLTILQVLFEKNQ
jgi:hypothetical protein